VTADRNTLDRRTFLKGAASLTPLALGLRELAGGQTPDERGLFGEDDIPAARRQLLAQVNAERSRARLSVLELDDLAGRVANEHARDMISGEFLSHWGRDGRKPYHRYSFAGGSEALQENVSYAVNIQSATRPGVLKDLHEMHQSMFDEAPPDDGHRKTILYPQHTHVGFGIARQGRLLALDELYLSRYVVMDPVPRALKRRARILISGRILYRNQLMTGIEVFYDPSPSPPSIAWLRLPRSYGMPDNPDQRLLPRLPDRYSYPDGSNGDVDVDSARRFQTRVGFSKPGIHTVVVWLKAGENGIPFPATQVCIRVE
jgi:hypothetical protein